MQPPEYPSPGVVALVVDVIVVVRPSQQKKKADEADESEVANNPLPPSQEILAYHNVLAQDAILVCHGVGNLLDLKTINDDPDQPQRQLQVSIHNGFISNRAQGLVCPRLEERQGFVDVGHLVDTHVAFLGFEWFFGHDLQQCNHSLAIPKVTFDRGHGRIARCGV